MSHKFQQEAYDDSCDGNCQRDFCFLFMVWKNQNESFCDRSESFV
jgi:hypothetical protein